MNEQDYLDKPEMTKVKSKRCLVCGHEKEHLFPLILKLNQETMNKINESNHEARIFVNQINRHIYELDGKRDDLTLKPINGMCYEVSTDLCLECIDKMGYKHKFKSKHLYNTRTI